MGGTSEINSRPFVQIHLKHQHGCPQDIRESAARGTFEGKTEGRAETSRGGYPAQIPIVL